MPTYEYECTKCGTVSEVFHSITEPPRRRLKKSDNANCRCDAPVTRHIGSGAGIIFKGSGFYETDYRSESYKKAAKAENDKLNGKDKKSDNGKASTSGETKSSGTDGGKKEATASASSSE
jgi:putative FmdB family regulatory protein